MIAAQSQRRLRPQVAKMRPFALAAVKLDPDSAVPELRELAALAGNSRPAVAEPVAAAQLVRDAAPQSALLGRVASASEAQQAHRRVLGVSPLAPPIALDCATQMSAIAIAEVASFLCVRMPSWATPRYLCPSVRARRSPVCRENCPHSCHKKRPSACPSRMKACGKGGQQMGNRRP